MTRTLDRQGRLLALVLFGALALGGCTLAGEPVPAGPIERGGAGDVPAPTLPPAPTIELPPDVGYPVETPDISTGATLFAARCTACHGPDGSGEGGEMLPTLTEQGVELPDFTDPDFVHQRTPTEFFQVITEGRLESFMPPWGHEFTETERWSLAFYLQTLPSSSMTLDPGQVIYEAECLACHGEGGAGDGPDAAGAMPDLTDPAAAAAQSSQALFDVISAGAGAGMPAFEGSLTEDERWAVVDYVRSFTYRSLPSPHAALEPSAESVTGAISGTVINLTTGQPVGEGQEVLLHGLIVTEADIQEILSLQTTTDAEGRYVFEDVPLDQEGLVYVADLAYEGIEFNNVAFVVPGETTTLDLPVEVYDTTQDESVLSVDTLHIVVSPQNVDTLLIAQIYVFSNSSDRAFISQQAISDTRRATVKMPVPPDAIGLAFEDGELGSRFVQMGDSVVDTAAVLPGRQSHSVVMTYLLPYDGDGALTVPVLYPTAQVSVLFEETGMRVRSESLSATESGDPQLDQFQILAGEGFSPGDEVVITIKGTPGAAAPIDNVGLMAVAAVAVLALVGAGVWWLRRGRSEDDAPQPQSAPRRSRGSERQSALMQAIADLDDSFEGGQIAQAEYEARRARLKADLLALIEEEGGA